MKKIKKMKYVIFYTKKVVMNDDQFNDLINLSSKINLNKKFEVINPNNVTNFDYENYTQITNNEVIETNENFNQKLTKNDYFKAYRSKLFNFLKPIILLRDTGICPIINKLTDKDIHHIDKNPLNNNPRNLIAISSQAHFWLHKNKINFDFQKIMETKEDFNKLIDKQIEEFNTIYNNKFKL